jgi:hypothetical protein
LQDRDNHETPAPRQPAERRPRLDTLSKVRRELALLYFEARQHRLDVLDASRLGNLLAVIARVLEGSELERRLEAVEERLEKGKRR